MSLPRKFIALETIVVILVSCDLTGDLVLEALAVKGQYDHPNLILSLIVLHLFGVFYIGWSSTARAAKTILPRARRLDKLSSYFRMGIVIPNWLAISCLLAPILTISLSPRKTLAKTEFIEKSWKRDAFAQVSWVADKQILTGEFVNLKPSSGSSTKTLTEVHYSRLVPCWATTDIAKAQKMGLLYGAALIFSMVSIFPLLRWKNFRPLYFPRGLRIFFRVFKRPLKKTQE